MIQSDFHVHTCYCDGNDKPEDIVIQAISLGMKKLGFSGHSYTPFDEDYCMSLANTESYRNEIHMLKEKYNGEIEILCGIEADYYSDIDASMYDYVIGSVHYVCVNGEYISVDHNPEVLSRLLHACNDDPYDMAERYYALVSDIVNKTHADIIGHFDLLTKFNEGNRFLDENHERYITASNRALDLLLETGKPFEINTGAISRGYRTSPYPSERILKYIAEHNGTVILSSDSHDKHNLMYSFNECEEIVRKLGLNLIEL